jgi:hypothetical protein
MFMGIDLPVHVAAEAGLHRVLHQHAHLERLAAAHAGGNLDAPEHHQSDSSRHAADVTSTSVCAIRKRLSEAPRAP